MNKQCRVDCDIARRPRPGWDARCDKTEVSQKQHAPGLGYVSGRKKMKKQNVGYWLATGVVAVIMAASGTLAILHVSQYMEALKHLGYPPYFANLLGIGKLTGVAILLVPRLGKLKEWAYAAFGITVLSACYSHLSSGDGWLALDPLATFAALVVSYARRPASRRATCPVNTRGSAEPLTQAQAAHSLSSLVSS